MTKEEFLQRKKRDEFIETAIVHGHYYGTLKKQLDKIPTLFPDGRFTYETVFPWFWVTWVSEIWQIDYAKADRVNKHILWSRLFIFSSKSLSITNNSFSVGFLNSRL